MAVSKVEMINLYMANAQQTPSDFQDIAAIRQHPTGIKAEQIYDKWVEWLLTAYPWPFSVKRVKLTRLNEVPPTTWSYAYQLPTNRARIWDVYSTTPNFNFPPTFDYSAYRSFFETGLAQDVAALEGETLVTNLEEVWLFYARNDVTESQFSPSFRRVLEREGSLELATQTNMDTERLIFLEKRYDTQIMEAKGLDSLENPVGSRLELSRMAQAALSR